MFERRHQPLLPRHRFLRRLANSAMLAVTIITVSLSIGVLGYRYFVGLPWIDAFLNASMILSGMGPIDKIDGAGAKLFAGCYALFSGVVFLSTAAILFAPIVHRVLHHFHAEQKTLSDNEQK